MACFLWQAHEKIQHIQKMADVMWSAVTADSQPTDVTEYVAQLQMENATLREVLSAGRHSLVSPVCSRGAQTDTVLSDEEEVNDSMSSSRCETVMSSSVVEVSQHDPTPTLTAVPPQTTSSLTDSSSSSAAAASSDSDVVVINDRTQQET